MEWPNAGLEAAADVELFFLPEKSPTRSRTSTPSEFLDCCQKERKRTTLGDGQPEGSCERSGEGDRRLMDSIGLKLSHGFPSLIERMERGTGIEPATSSLGSWHSTAELPPH